MAWLKKIFGTHQEEPLDAGEEPSRFEPVRHAQTGSFDANKTVPVKTPAAKGFDPYNSGAFKRDDAWKRVTRK